ncbi:HGL202Cp [Eremothecium sinecaudum]|uniref:N-acetyltransferase ECO1 n=1 Tax=Eremothecium sinecaudum TaxID=45286 RepID=A0A109UZX2_9SACH|nr:HGL202Cp [Eremothecium sinecaudum]AMD22138.1 HGL202Cp [Eremothecium sinecaudum]
MRVKTPEAKRKKSPKKSSRLFQAKLKLPNDPNSGLTTCIECQMTYSSNSSKDILEHNRYHDLHTNGKKWFHGWGTILMNFENNNAFITPPSTSSSDCENGTTRRIYNEYIAAISPEKPIEVKHMIELMNAVNRDLSAPADNEFWSEAGSKNQGRAFIYVKNGRAVGAITIEYIKETDSKGRWMRLSNRNLVPKVVAKVKLGISRIWVCKSQRRNGLATRLLECARTHSIIGNQVARWEMAWSQPSESGSLLARKYNSVKHKSGELLVPCYI